MSSATTLTGRNGSIWVNSINTGGVMSNPAVTPIQGDMVLRTTQWAVNPTLATSTEWGDSSSNPRGFTNRATGRDDATFTAEGKFDAGTEVFDVFEPEDYASVALFLADTVAGLHWTFPRAMCTDFNLTVNVDSEEVIGWTSSWGSDGPFYYPGQAADDNVGAPAVPDWNLSYTPA